jgi:isoleucyl-tRNA synthetase
MEEAWIDGNRDSVFVHLEQSSSACTLDDVKGAAVVSHRAKGERCARSWRNTDDVGSHPELSDATAPDAAALRERKELGQS